MGAPSGSVTPVADSSVACEYMNLVGLKRAQNGDYCATRAEDAMHFRAWQPWISSAIGSGLGGESSKDLLGCRATEQIGQGRSTPHFDRNNGGYRKSMTLDVIGRRTGYFANDVFHVIYYQSDGVDQFLRTRWISADHRCQRIHADRKRVAGTVGGEYRSVCLQLDRQHCVRRS